MSWRKRVSDIRVGDTVQFTAAFCRNTGQTVGETPFLKGKVVEMKPFGDNVLAKVDWGDGEPIGVLVCNLKKVGSLEVER